MATIHVRNVPDDLYERIRKLADRSHRSLGAEVITLLEAGIRRDPDEQRSLFEKIRQEREALEREHGTFPSSVEIIREDRDCR